MPGNKPIAIDVEQSLDGYHFDFTYAPTTVHLRAGDEVSFRIVKGPVQVENLLLLFSQSPFKDGDTEIRVADGTPTMKVIGATRGAFHYKAIGDVVVKGERRVAYDVWCPSIIVD